jgi:WhiB family redox-sensing transcriptional regulator
MVDELDEGGQAPRLTELEEARAGVQLSRRLAVESLMATQDMPDVELLLDELVNRPPWHRQAACRGVGPDLFFPDRGDRLDKALAYCDGCVVRSQCLDSALQVATTTGVWGGTSGRHRKGLRRAVA